ncbi:MAG: NAD(P)H-hydrate dehydratase [Clostridiales bacterium]|nr:NAD(P)H-hydrate dehydratase [Clostridiales bacterium]
MRYLLTNEQMRKADEFAMQNTPALLLMERAGKALAEKIRRLNVKGNVLCVCGGGNNGGDGFVCARYLLELGFPISVFCNAKKFSQETEINKRKYLKTGGKIVEELPNLNVDLLVDCLLGTGFKGELKEESKRIIEKINLLKAQGAYVLSADVPSGLGDNGLSKVSVLANETLCVGQEKLALRLLDGLDCSGKVSTMDIGIDVLEIEKKNYVTAIEKQDVKERLPKRKRNSHKGSFGKVAVVGGSLKYTGAPYLSALSALRSGVGYTALFVPNGIAEYYILKAPEILLERLNGGGSIEFNEKDFEKMLDYGAVCFGMGLGESEDVCKGVEYLLENYTGKLVLDADGLNSLAKFGSTKCFLNKKCEVLVTPHVKEFSRLTSLSVEEILNDCVAQAKTFAKEKNVTLLLKGASTIITDGNKTILNLAGCSAQAKGGTGDVLAGVIGGLCAQGLSIFDAGACGSYLVGISAEIASQELSCYSALPSDFIQNIGKAFKYINE